MKRRIVLATFLTAVIAGSAGAALGSPVDTKKNDVCIAMTQNDNYQSADYYCVDVQMP